MIRGIQIQQLIILKVIVIETRCMQFWNCQVIIFSYMVCKTYIPILEFIKLKFDKN